MWWGVEGVSGCVMSGSPNKSGENKTRERRVSITNKSPKMSLIV